MTVDVFTMLSMLMASLVPFTEKMCGKSCYSAR